MARLQTTTAALLLLITAAAFVSHLISSKFWLAVLLGIAVIVLSRKLHEDYCCVPASSVVAVAVVVLGDIGRSPRMQNHALAIRRMMMSTATVNQCSSDEVSCPTYQQDSNNDSKETSRTSKDLGASEGVRASKALRSQQYSGTHQRNLSIRPVLVGYRGSKCCSEVENDLAIEIVRLNDPIVDRWRLQLLRFGPVGFLLFAFLKILDISIRLCWSLLLIPNLRAVIVQNPPTFPTVPLIWALSRLSGFRFFVDWHNYGTSILALSPVARRFCAVSRFVEQNFGRLADHAFCVSEAMRIDLIANWFVPSSRLSLLYDKPSSSFRPLSLIDRHEILFRYFPKGFDSLTAAHGSLVKSESVLSWSVIAASSANIRDQISDANVASDTSLVYCTVTVPNSKIPTIDLSPKTVADLPSFAKAPYLKLKFANRVQSEISLFTALTQSNSSSLPSSLLELSHLTSRPALIVTSTSWTLDEDLDLLLESVCQYDSEVAANSNKMKLPQLILVVTGVGPRRVEWLEKAAKKNLINVKVRSVFLPFDDYWRILGAADLGICLHTSASGVDLPMKAVDMRGVCLPVLAINFPAITELVIAGVTGELFSTAEELTQKLVQLLSGFPTEHKLMKLRLSCEEAKRNNWDDEWRLQALPVFQQLVSG